MFTNLFNIKNSSFSEGKLSVWVKLNASHDIFGGHFPGQPILPGVCQLALIKELIEKHLNRKLIMRKSQQVKFTSMLDPRHTPEIEVQITVSEADGSVTAHSTILFGEITFLKLKAQYADA